MIRLFIFIILTLVGVTFISGCEDPAIQINKTEIKMSDQKPKVNGIGGIFFKTKDPEKIKKMVRRKLGACN